MVCLIDPLTVHAHGVAETMYRAAGERGWDPKEVVYSLVDPNKSDMFRYVVAQCAPEGLRHYDRAVRLMIEGYEHAARKAGDVETADYVASLLRGDI
jgi:hypothetical protein